MKTDREVLQWIDGFLKGKLSLTAAEKEIQNVIEAFLNDNNVRQNALLILNDWIGTVNNTGDLKIQKTNNAR